MKTVSLPRSLRHVGEFAFYGCSDYCVGDYVTAIMNTNGTPDIKDDYFLKVHYSGYCDYSGENLE